MNTNGESGTISANDYIKGDSSFLFVTPATEGESLSPTNKKLIQKVLMQSLSQKGDPLQSFKILAVKEGAKGADGQPYVICDFSYELNTEAGFLIGRRGTVSMTSVGPNIQALVSVTTFQRFKKMGETLSDIANTFRVYKLNSGVFSGAGAGATASN